MRTTHYAEKIHTLDPEHGFIQYVRSSPDARSVAFMTKTGDRGGRQRIVWNGRLVAESGRISDRLHDDLSPDGRHLAVIRDDHARGGLGAIDIDGVPTYLTDLSVIHHSGWLDNERFAWEGWAEGEDGRIDDAGIRYFVNGEEVTGRMSFDGIGDGKRSGLRVQDGDQVYTVWEDGERTASPSYTLTLGYANDPEKMRGRPSIVHEIGGRSRVLHRGIVSSFGFDGIEDNHGLREFETSSDASVIAYAGIRYAKWAAKASHIGSKLMALADDHEERTGKEPHWALPFAVLYSPYTPFLHHSIESSRRYYPVKARYHTMSCEERVWKKGYRRIDDLLLTPSGELVATANGRMRQRVVIDEVEGPKFDRVWNVCHVAEDDSIAYVAQRGNDLLRVTVRRS